ncbi:hypothetical protein BDK51DRAFT_38532 [Blyttiomyces helicus]|uniref:Uncharacterized protein n=1 Tax=Blyttiomyces helicus TaxID=388810 RepID=A0A4P9W4Y9_9FUNG|nr:hypothetical protein BDK51DRAFT_38532 [Blyttiomyces helicus]|eukprot:RKO87294.1 hypothetical protein BDK51DRAFT_38532 [Blyttiomyces helicus]
MDHGAIIDAPLYSVCFVSDSAGPGESHRLIKHREPGGRPRRRKTHCDWPKPEVLLRFHHLASLWENSKDPLVPELSRPGASPVCALFFARLRTVKCMGRSTYYCHIMLIMNACVHSTTTVLPSIIAKNPAGSYVAAPRAPFCLSQLPVDPLAANQMPMAITTWSSHREVSQIPPTRTFPKQDTAHPPDVLLLRLPRNRGFSQRRDALLFGTVISSFFYQIAGGGQV